MAPRSGIVIPLSILGAAVIIGGAVYSALTNRQAAADDTVLPELSAKNVPDPRANEHILGSPNAPVVLIEYTDLECPYCQSFHFTLKALMEDYGKKGQLAWVVRHMPIPQLHPKALKEHEAAECAAELGGNQGFFAFIDGVFERTPGNNGLDPELLPVIAAEIGLNKDAFSECLASGRHAELVKLQAAEGYNAGARGTPYTLTVYRGEKIPVPGAQPYKSMRSIIDVLLARETSPNAVPKAF